MDIVQLEQVAPFTTKDGSEIRELLAHRNSALRNQSLAEARVPVGGGDHGALPSPRRGDLFHHPWNRSDPVGRP